MRIIKPAAAVIIFLAIMSLIGDFKSTDAKSHEKEVYLYDGRENLQCLYYDERDFVNIKNFEVRDVKGSIRGCILPHHLIAADLIHEVFQNVGSQYETVVLIGPDHESINKGKVFTTLKDWQTPMGILETDTEITGGLLKDSFILTDDEKLTKEHSASGMIPYIKYYMNDVKVVTLVLTKQVKSRDMNKLIENLYESVDAEKTLFIAAVDFSHYLNLENAERMDSITMKAIEDRDIRKIMSFTNDNLDSPPSIAALLKMMNKLNAADTYLLNHSNSELVSKIKTNETTSYLTYLFCGD